ncbi:pyridoxamine 5'-phosphate oxidase family protein [Solirubrobacter phytolaccae]|uniref:Pyridoxamine 5'-phosphate oxidase family protein n=1 Tax=Solirubrobacter phytolaccae TaxID=1404360 RepID=A0A9X3N7B4_9ACTN|nr:pyridoxamine 5'-phosphate oxidase family protein [Solirubrobacter phytolaccae]MDA0179790.1 pyridoxamine 5'-phosphate oxidase family protein [Solirubrobacter phytolaccae]
MTTCKLEGMGYHAGELAVQRRAGVTGVPFGAETELPEVARDFLEEQLWLVLGAEDAEGRVWASVLYGWPGFISSPEPHSLVIASEPLPGDPLTGALDGPVGGLAIEPSTRRRLRLNGRATSADGEVTIALEQVYGNCPKYITARDVEAVVEATPAPPAASGAIDARARQLLAAADTAFVATRGPDGLDVSHRGGRPGFLQVRDERTIVWPDYPGNRMFNTLGNLAADGRLGLTVVDPEDGTTLYVTGRASILWDEARAVELRVDAVVRLDRAAPLRWRFERAARNPPLETGQAA